MDNKATKTAETDLEKKTTELSKKVWELQRSPVVVKISSNGKIDNVVAINLKATLKNNQVVATDYIDGDKRRMIMKIENEIYYSDFTKI